MLHDSFRDTFHFVEGVMLATADRVLTPADNREIGYLDMSNSNIGMTLQLGEAVALIFWTKGIDFRGYQTTRDILILALNKFGGRLGVMVLAINVWGGVIQRSWSNPRCSLKSHPTSDNIFQIGQMSP
jgi:hypothetical protein